MFTLFMNFLFGLTHRKQKIVFIFLSVPLLSCRGLILVGDKTPEENRSMSNRALFRVKRRFNCFETAMKAQSLAAMRSVW